MHLLFSERLSDVIFVVGASKKKRKRIPAHTLKLAEASDVFQTMFSHNWKNDKPIRVIDFEAPTFCSLLRWIYCDELIFPPDMLVDVVRIAQKYMVHSLISFVADNFENMDKMYVWSIHTTAIELDLSDLAQNSLKLIDSDQVTHLASADFLNASCVSVKAFFALERSSSITELQLFTRCFEWSEKECERRGLEVQPANQRTVMKPFIHQISFGSMTVAEFAGLPCESAVLKKGEQAAIFRTIGGKDVESRFKKKQQPEGTTCKNWKPAELDYHFYCSHCYRYVCMDCFAAETGRDALLFCSNCRSYGGTPYTMTLIKVSRDDCAGSA